jgi:hypothetical protein
MSAGVGRAPPDLEPPAERYEEVVSKKEPFTDEHPI